MRISQRPIISIEKKTIDKYLETLVLLFFVLLIAIPFYFYSSLPETIPIHFNAHGEADGYSSKALIWLLPIIGILTHFLFKWLNKRPHILNYPVKITEENAKKQYSLALRIMRIIDLLTLMLFSNIVYQIYAISINEVNQNTPWYPILYILLIFFALGVYLYLARKKE